MAKKNKGTSTLEVPPARKDEAPLFVEVEGMGAQGTSKGKQATQGNVLIGDKLSSRREGEILYADQLHPKRGVVVVEPHEPNLGVFHEGMGATKIGNPHDTTSKPILVSDKLLEKPGVVLVEQPVHDEVYKRVKGTVHKLAGSGDVVVSDSHEMKERKVDEEKPSSMETKEIKENPSTENKDAEVKSGAKEPEPAIKDEPKPDKGSKPGE